MIIHEIMILLVRMLVKEAMIMTIHQYKDNDGIEKKAVLNGHVMNANMLIEVQMRLVRIADKVNNLQAQV